MAVTSAITAVGKAPWQVTHSQEVQHLVLPCIYNTYFTLLCLRPRNFIDSVVQIVVCVLPFTTTATF